MNERSDIGRVLRHWLEDGPDVMPDRVVDTVAARISVNRQRRMVPLVGRTAPVNRILSYIAAVAAVVIAAIVIYQFLPANTANVGGQPTPSPAATPLHTPGSTPMALHDGPLVAGRYLLQPFSDLASLAFTADLPAGWSGIAPVGAVGPRGPEGPDGIAFATIRVDGLFSDPCHWDLDGTGNPEQAGDVEIGPGTDDLTQALLANVSYEASEASWAGFPAPESGLGETVGLRVEVRLPDTVNLAACDRDPDGESRYYVFSGLDAGLYAQGTGNLWVLNMVEVGGTRLVVVLSYFDGTPAADLAAGEAILGSLDFKP